MPNARLGLWPIYYYDRDLISYDESGNQIAIDSAKNKQPMFMNNWFGGQKDHRISVVGWDGRP